MKGNKREMEKYKVCHHFRMTNCFLAAENSQCHWIVRRQDNYAILEFYLYHREYNVQRTVDTNYYKYCSGVKYFPLFAVVRIRVPCTDERIRNAGRSSGWLRTFLLHSILRSFSWYAVISVLFYHSTLKETVLRNPDEKERKKIQPQRLPRVAAD